MPEENPDERRVLVLWSQEILADVSRIKTILQCGVFAPENDGHPLSQSAFIELMICLNDLLAKANQKDVRIGFTDDVPVSRQVKDITDLVAMIRNAACHMPSGTRHVDDAGNRFSFCSMAGKVAGVLINDVVLEAEYEDDMAFFYGSLRIYLKRHVLRSFKEAKDALIPLTCYPPHFF